MQSAQIGVGLIGTGFMGACHAQAYIAASHAFEPELRPALATVADNAPGAAAAAAARFGFARSTEDWRELVVSPDIELVSITTPNFMHKEMALTAIEAGKHVWCEKPLALNAADAKLLAEAAKERGVVCLGGYNYLRSPAVAFAKRLIEAGELGSIASMRALFDEDYMASPAVPFSWRCRNETAGSGAVGDMASHVVSLMRFLVGPITEVSAVMRTSIAERPAPVAGAGREDRSGQAAVDWNRMEPVENEDVVEAILRFANGAIGHLGSSRIAWGRKNGLDFEIFGSLGALRFSQERFNEIQLFRPSDRQDDNGYRTIFMGPAHPPYARFNPAVGHGLGFNELKVAEAAHLLDAIAGKCAPYPDFQEGYEIERVGDALLESADARRWVSIGAS
ncbi:MAG: Gfo/Idh/MocA family oxidoreductase [Pseudomonadota bacterium]